MMVLYTSLRFLCRAQFLVVQNLIYFMIMESNVLLLPVLEPFQRHATSISEALLVHGLVFVLRYCELWNLVLTSVCF